MQVLACSSDWALIDGAYKCLGQVHQVPADNIPQGISFEDAKELSGLTLSFFAVIAAALLIRKAIA